MIYIITEDSKSGKQFWNKVALFATLNQLRTNLMAGNLDLARLVLGCNTTLEEGCSKFLNSLLKGHSNWSFAKSRSVGTCWTENCCPQLQHVPDQYRKSAQIKCDANTALLFPGVSGEQKLRDILRDIVKESPLYLVLNDMIRFFGVNAATVNTSITSFFSQYGFV